MLEKVALASIREQRAARQWKTFVRMAWLAFFAVLAWMLLQRSTTDARTLTAPHTALVEIRGEIAETRQADRGFGHKKSSRAEALEGSKFRPFGQAG